MANDPHWNNISLLLPMTGENNSTTFTDYGPSPKTATPHGNAKISTTKSKWNKGSGRFDGAGDYISVPNSASLQLGSSDFTIEGWINLEGYANNNNGYYNASIITKDVAGNREFSFEITGTSNSFTTLAFVGFASNTGNYQVATCNFSFSLDTWYHIAACRSGNLLYLFADRTLLNPGGSSFNIALQQTSAEIKIGARLFGDGYDYYANAYINDIRITKGIARYTDTFTLPDKPFQTELTAYKVQGIAAFTDGAIAETIRAWKTEDGSLVGSATPDPATGAFDISVPDELQVDITIFRSGYRPLTHGPVMSVQ